MVHALKALALFGAAFTLAQAASIPVSRSSKHVSRKAKRKCSGTTAPVPVPPPSTGDQQPVPDPQPEPVPEPTPEPDNGSDGKYNKKDDFVGEDFYNQFDFFTGDDPTHGRVDYVNMNTARGMNLTSVGANSFILRADQGYTDPGSRGRKSVRIGSKNSYETHVLVADILHIPEGTPSWPALWEVGADWPNNGELDIIEGVNDRGPNLMSLHTSGGCMQQWGGRDMKGTGQAENCDWLANGNQGCGASGDSPESFGPGFNAVRGGWYAVERTNSYIKIWFWGRNDNSVPDEVRNNLRGVNPDTWGRPTVLFNNDGCNIGEKFGPNQLIINLTFCGDWAGATYPGGPQACINDVNNGGDWTSRSFWEIARISMYT